MATSRLNFRLVTGLLERFAHTLRMYICNNDICQLISIGESYVWETVCLRVTLVGHHNTLELELQKQLWCAFFNCLQNEARVQFEERGLRTAYFSFCLSPSDTNTPARDGYDELKSELYLAVRFSDVSKCSAADLAAPVDIQIGKTGFTEIGFPISESRVKK